MSERERPVGKYMVAHKFTPEDGAVAGVEWVILNRKSRAPLAEICYYAHWRQYVLAPWATANAVFNNSCLRDIAAFLDECNATRKLAAASPQQESKP